MTVEQNLANITSTLIKNFAEPTVEFLWEENSQLTFSALSQCIILSCILLNFHSFELERKLQHDKIETETLHEIKSPYQFVTESHVKIFRNHRHSSNKFILFSDTTFPSINRSSLLNLNYKVAGYRKQHRKYPFIIISSLLDHPILSTDPENWKYSLDLSSIILLFVAHASGAVRLGYVCNVSVDFPWYNIRIATFPVATNELSSSNILLSLWERLHSTTRFESEHQDTDTDLSCIPMSFSGASEMFDDTCVFQTTYCKLRNCSRETCCATIYTVLSTNIYPTSLIYPYFQILPFVQNQIDFRIQILFPAQNLFETNLTAFLYPFCFKVWLSCLVGMTAVSLWFIGYERQSICKVLFWQHSIILEQDGQFGNMGARGSTLIIIWMLSLFLIRQFYGSSLYSFMTTKNEPSEYPKDIHEALARSDFDFICSSAFETRLLFVGLHIELPRKLFNFYVSILSRSYFTIPESGKDFETLTQQNASHGKKTRVYSRIYNKTYENSTRLFIAMVLAYAQTTYNSIVFNRFIYICEPGCMDGPGFFGQTMLVHKSAKDHPLLTYHEFWFQTEPCFESFRFAKFLSRFVKSGLYELEVSRYKKLKQVKRLKKLEGSRKRGWSNGSLFSYAFLDASAKERAQKENVEESMKIVALKGTFILMEVLVLVCVVIFLVELRITKG
ncbi:unnamed protein product [Orchesella dallaii]|uniref:Uncharacterized protein n=1 Tax=Orchesella dallaii TaxID=48710 RepID=A0ABP1RGP5_9HEXA